MSIVAYLRLHAMRSSGGSAAKQLVCALAVAIGSILFVSSNESVATPPKEYNEAWEKELSGMQLDFARLWNCHSLSLIDDSVNELLVSTDDVKFHLVFGPKRNGVLELVFYRGDEKTLSLVGHGFSSFQTLKDVIYFAQYFPDTPGCTVVAYDLSGGNVLWKAKMQQPHPSGFSGYRNRVRISTRKDTFRQQVAPVRTEATQVIVVAGCESYCDYVAILSTDGELIAHRDFRVGFAESNDSQSDAIED